MEDKSLDITRIDQASERIGDLEVFGNGDAWRTICKASDQSQGWTKSTKAMSIANLGCLVHVTTQQQNPDGSYALGEALTFIPGAYVMDWVDHLGNRYPLIGG